MSLIIANWKMNFLLNEVEEFCSELTKISHTRQLIIAAPAIYLAYLSNKFSSLKFASQNLSIFNPFGSYTGEYSATMLKSCNINYSLIGHAERRKLFNEDNNTIFLKAKNASTADITPIICIGEPLEQRQQLTYQNFIFNQLQNLVVSNYKSLIIAYEPIWAIGTSTIIDLDDLVEIFSIIKNYLKKCKLEKKCKLVYGGSVSLNNINQILSLKNIDGVLIGNASLNCKNLIEILKGDIR